VQFSLADHNFRCILKENRVRYLFKYYNCKWFLIRGKIMLKYYISIYESGPVKTFPAIKQYVYFFTRYFLRKVKMKILL